MVHPASLLLLWMAAAFALQQLDLAGLLVGAALVLPVVLVAARRRALRMLRRSRWLLLSLAVLFVFATPGEYVSPLPGVTREGLELAAEHLLRLTLLLLLLALLLERLDTAALMSGLYLLLKPAAVAGFDRRQAVVRLMLVLDYVQGSPGERGWRDWLAAPAEPVPAALRLPVRSLGAVDVVLLAALAAALAGLLPD